MYCALEFVPDGLQMTNDNAACTQRNVFRPAILLPIVVYQWARVWHCAARQHTLYTIRCRFTLLCPSNKLDTTSMLTCCPLPYASVTRTWSASSATLIFSWARQNNYCAEILGIWIILDTQCKLTSSLARCMDRLKDNARISFFVLLQGFCQVDHHRFHERMYLHVCDELS